MRLSMMRRCLIFGTFFGACIAGALLAGALATPNWVQARATRDTTPPNNHSKGHLHFGLFAGRKDLNYAYGWRTFNISVINLVRSETELLHPAGWMSTVAFTGAGLCLAALSALFAAVNTATTPSSKLASIPGLYLWNTLSVLADAVAVATWIFEYYTKLQYNVLPVEDQANKWTTEGMVEFGSSFWFVVVAAVISALNIITVIIATSDTKDKDPITPMIEEKSNGAIMLY